jgi:hypothetical protein
VVPDIDDDGVAAMREEQRYVAAAAVHDRVGDQLGDDHGQRVTDLLGQVPGGGQAPAEAAHGRHAERGGGHDAGGDGGGAGVDGGRFVHRSLLSLSREPENQPEKGTKETPYAVREIGMRSYAARAVRSRPAPPRTA